MLILSFHFRGYEAELTWDVLFSYYSAKMLMIILSEVGRLELTQYVFMSVMESVVYDTRLKWSRTCSTTRSVTNAPAFTAVESLLRSSAPTWPACSITASLAGLESTRRPVESFTSRLSRRAPTGRVRCRSAGVKTRAVCDALKQLSFACRVWLVVRFTTINTVRGFLIIIVVLLLCFCGLLSATCAVLARRSYD